MLDSCVCLISYPASEISARTGIGRQSRSQGYRVCSDSYNRPIQGRGWSFESETTTSLPPGFSTRRHSLSTRGIWGESKSSRVKLEKTPSKIPSRNGIGRVLLRTKLIRSVKPAFTALFWAIRLIPSDRSNPALSPPWTA